jgi:phytoene dehydrogenase-like protein
MAYRATPNTITGYSPFFLLHGREIEIHSNDNLKARLITEDPNQDRRLENLRTSLKFAYKLAAKTNRSAPSEEERLRSKSQSTLLKCRRFSLTIQSAVKSDLTRKFHRPWAGLFKITRKISELKYEIVSQTGKRQVIHVNRLKKFLIRSFGSPSLNRER